MSIKSQLKKTVTLAGILAAASVSVYASGDAPKNNDEALDMYTGENQPVSGHKASICVKASPYFLASMIPGGKFASTFYSMQIDGVSKHTAAGGECQEVNADTKKCERGFIKITSTAPISCNVPIGL